MVLGRRVGALAPQRDAAGGLARRRGAWSADWIADGYDARMPVATIAMIVCVEVRAVVRNVPYLTGEPVDRPRLLGNGRVNGFDWE